MTPITSNITSDISQKMPSQEDFQKRKQAENDATEYTKFLFSTFAKFMLETLDDSDNPEENMVRSSFMADALGASLANSPSGEQIQADMLENILFMTGQESDKKRPYPSASSPYQNHSPTHKEHPHVAYAA